MPSLHLPLLPHPPDLNMALDASDVDTPRGISAKNEVRRLRTIIMERSQETIQLMARARFAELDVDKSGFLENAELISVVNWVMSSFGDKLGTDRELVRSRMMARLDINKDGKLDVDEFEGLFHEMLNRSLLIERARTKFEEFDENKNGTIESDEIKRVIDWTVQAYPVANIGDYTKRLIETIDLNKDGQLDLLEFTNLFEDMLVRVSLVEKAKAKFHEMDKDGSGLIEKHEIDGVVDWVLESHVEKTAEQKAAFRSQLLSRIDANQDGNLDLKEFTDLFGEMLDRYEMVEQAKVKFAKLDKNQSGYLEKDELTEVLTSWVEAYGKTNASGGNSSELVDEILTKMDVNQDGRLDFREFIELFEEVMLKQSAMVHSHTHSNVQIKNKLWEA
jgi:Ca2+-binding EF-hand superfamily protein